MAQSLGLARSSRISSVNEEIIEFAMKGEVVEMAMNDKIIE